MNIHTTRDGVQMPISEMRDSHIRHTIAMIERKAKSGVFVQDGGGSEPDDYWYEEYTLYGNEALAAMGYAAYIDELRRRINK